MQEVILWHSLYFVEDLKLLPRFFFFFFFSQKTLLLGEKRITEHNFLKYIWLCAVIINSCVLRGMRQKREKDTYSPVKFHKKNGATLRGYNTVYTR